LFIQLCLSTPTLGCYTHEGQDLHFITGNKFNEKN
jgi:hypothetical protein